MRRFLVGVLLCIALSGDAAAQGVAEGLAAAQQQIAANEWAAALELLLGLQQQATSDPERDQLATRLTEVGDGLRDASAFDAALRAHAAALALRQRCHGDRDHADVAVSLNNVALCRLSLGQTVKAFQQFEAALAMRTRLYGDRDHPDVANSLHNVAACLMHLGQPDKALPQIEAALAMRRRLFGDGDHLDVALSLNSMGGCFESLGQLDRALPQFEAALAMYQRLYGDRDDQDVASNANNVAYCLKALGQADLALPRYEAVLAMQQRLYGDRDHPDVAWTLNNMASCLLSLGQADKALPQSEAALAMNKRLYDDRDHGDVAASLNNLASCLLSLGRPDKALAQNEAALAMWRRLHGDHDHPHVAGSLENVADCLRLLGQVDKSLHHCEAALAMWQRLHGDRDHPQVATSLNNLAACLRCLGRADEALPRYQSALAMQERLYGDRDHPEKALTRSNVGSCMLALGQADQALLHYEAALAMRQRLHGDHDHTDVANSLSCVANCLHSLGQAGKALATFEAALTMHRRLYGDRDHPDVATGLDSVASCLEALGQADQALPQCELACAMMERLREHSETSAELRQSLFDELKRFGAFERLQTLAARTGRPADAVHAAERSRARDLLDTFEQQRFDPLAEALRRARRRGDATLAARLQQLGGELDAATFENDRLLHQLTRLDDAKLSDEQRQARRKDLIAESERATLARRQLLDERARLVADVLAVGRVHTAAEIQAALQAGELLLEFTVTDQASLLYVFAHDASLQALPLPTASATVQRTLPLLLRQTSRDQLDDRRGRDPDAGRAPASAADAASGELFASLIPQELWPRLQSARRVFVAAHRALHRLPFELLVTDQKDGKPIYWLDSGPAIAYVQSGSALCWQRQRANEADDAAGLDLLTIGDPRLLDAETEVPEQGAFVLTVDEAGEGRRVGLLPRDVLVRYDGELLVDDTTLRERRLQVDAAIGDGQRPNAPLPIEVWRGGATLQFDVNPGPLGIMVGKGKARQAHEASRGGDAELECIKRRGDLERLGHLPPLRGARREAEEITAQFAAKGRKVERLLGKDATEPAVFDLAAKAKYLHFACHGIAEEYAGQSLSMLVLSQPEHVLPEDDGLLKLDDLLHRWRGRLASCRLVVLSACRTNVGPLYRDEAPQALPLGFLFAGASAVVSSLWAVDDASTRELMTDFYGRLLAGEPDRLKAFTAAKKALRVKYPEPYHWAPFLYLGSPE